MLSSQCGFNPLASKIKHIFNRGVSQEYKESVNGYIQERAQWNKAQEVSEPEMHSLDSDSDGNDESSDLVSNENGTRLVPVVPIIKRLHSKRNDVRYDLSYQSFPVIHDPEPYFMSYIADVSKKCSRKARFLRLGYDIIKDAIPSSVLGRLGVIYGPESDTKLPWRKIDGNRLNLILNSRNIWFYEINAMCQAILDSIDANRWKATIPTMLLSKQKTRVRQRLHRDARMQETPADRGAFIVSLIIPVTADTDLYLVPGSAFCSDDHVKLEERAKITVKVGEVLIFNAQLVHAGAPSNGVRNLRIHAFGEPCQAAGVTEPATRVEKNIVYNLEAEYRA